MHCAIIGAGIGGLATAVALQRQGRDTVVYERAVGLAPVGAGILMPPNALAVLATYGLAGAVRAAGHTVEALVLTDHRGAVLSRTPAGHGTGVGHLSTVALHRGALQRVLLDALAPGSLRLDARCEHVVPGGDRMAFTLNGDAVRHADLLVGADGVHSRVRKALFPDSALRCAGQHCWRGVATVRLAPRWRSQLTEMWGVGARFGFVSIGPDQVYWYATVSAPGAARAGTPVDADLGARFAAFADPVGELLSATPVNARVAGPLQDLARLPRWSVGHATLLGDAAHAATPNLGQGGAQAIEDSHALAKALQASACVPIALERFRAARVARVDTVVNRSWRLGQAVNLRHPWVCRLRNAALQVGARVFGPRPTTSLYQWPSGR
ncbi:MAG: FAD-dependent monooxygenase [Pseudomonadota bacterium]